MQTNKYIKYNNAYDNENEHCTTIVIKFMTDSQTRKRYLYRTDPTIYRKSLVLK